MFEKQQRNYNIISVQPREYQDTIKLFPKYRLENLDHNYFRKMQLERELADKMQANRQEIRMGRRLDEEPPKPMRGKYLNNVDEVADIL